MLKGLALKGKTYEDIYGKNIAKEKRRIRSETHKKNWKNASEEKREYYRKLAKDKIRKGTFGRKKGAKFGPRPKHIIKKIKEKNTKWKTKEQYVEEVKKQIKLNNDVPLSVLLEEYNKYNLPSRRIIYKFFNSVDELVNELDIDVIRRKPLIKTNISRIGKNEEQILQHIEKRNGVCLERQYYVNGCYIDGYDKDNNVAYEIDESHHTLLSHRIKDISREKRIKESLGCNIVRIDEKIILNKIENNQLIEMVK